MCMLACAVLAACGTPGAPMPPELELAKPVTDLRAARKGDKVYLAWTVPAQTTDHQTVRHPGLTRVCRSLNLEIGDCKIPAAEIPPDQFPVPPFDSKKGAPAPKIQARYTDILPQDLQTQNPTAEITYAVSALNQSGRSAGLSNLVQVPAAPTLVKQALARIGDVNFADCSQSQFLDQTFEWEKHYDYFAAVVTVVSLSGKPEVEVESNDTPIIQVFAHDTFPPAVPGGVQAVFSGVGQAPFIDLVWSPDTEADLAGYNVFRHEEGSQPAKLNAELVRTPAYRDASVQSGKKYFYSVSAVDERNNESARSEETSEQVP